MKIVFLILAGLCSASAVANDLPSWRDGDARAAIVSFVERVSTHGGAEFVPARERIAVFDNDGTLWAEQPAYFQLLYAVDRVREMADQHPGWKDQQPFKGVLEGDMKAALAGGEKAILELVMASHAGITTEAFAESVSTWLTTARHPVSGRPFTEMVYQPMLELLDYLRDHDFQVYIVSGGGIDFLRVFAEDVYGVPPNQVVGSSVKTRYEVRDGRPVLVKIAEIDFIDDKAGKPVGIHQHIGRRPIAAFGNSDGDLQMLQWTTAGDGARLGLLVHHTDAEREWAYDRDSHIGGLDKALDLAGDVNWIVVDMKNDWTRVFPE